MKIRDRIKELRRVKASELHPNPKNWRTHPKQQLDALRGILAEVGFAGAELARELPDGSLQLIDGHARAEIAGDAEIPVLVLDVTESEADKILATFDPLGAMAEADAGKLEELLREVQTGSEALAEMLAELAGDNGILDSLGDPEITEDEPPEPPVDPITKPGDLWILGEHRLLCGDSTKAEDVGRLMAGAKADMMFTDPPYGVEYVGKTKAALTIQNDGAADLPKLLDGSFAGAMQATKNGACWYVAAPPGPLHWEFAKRLMDLGVYRQTLVWVKDSMVLGHSDYHYKHEPIFYGWHPGASHREPPDRTQVSVWEIPRPKRSEEHPTMKPVELVAKAVGNSSARGDAVYEPFCGSGTTLIAAEQLGRKCYGMEISPQYCDVIVKRWENLTGKKAVLENGHS